MDAAALPPALLALQGAEESESMFGPGPALWVDGKEVCHRDAGGRFDVRLTRAAIREQRERLRQDPRVHLRRSGSDWIQVEVGSADDEGLLVELVGIAVAAHRPPAGVMPAPPPTGAALAARRRFH
jgi:hypothetical protein